MTLQGLTEQYKPEPQQAAFSQPTHHFTAASSVKPSQEVVMGTPLQVGVLTWGRTR